MSDQEYFLILPHLLYGLAIADLVSSWRTFFVKEKRYAPYIVTSLLLLEVAFWNFYQMNQWVTSETFVTYFSYFQLLTPPLVFLLVIGVFTPDAADTKQYFKDHMRIVFGLMAIFTASHFFF